MTTDALRVLAWPAYKQRAQNPYTWLLYTHVQTARVEEFTPWKLLRGSYAAWHMHWPETLLNHRRSAVAFARAQGLLRMMDVARAKGTKTIWTVHNLASHEQRHPGLESCFWNSFVKRLDGYISLSRSGLLAAQQRFPVLEQIPGIVIPHGHYREEYPADDALDARSALGLRQDARVVLFFGAVRAYKGIQQLVNAFRQLPQQNLMLLVAGKCRSQELANEIAKTSRDDERIRLELRYIEREDVHLYFRAADVVILPYSEILNSGTALLALSFNRPVLVPDKGAMSELQADVGAEWVRTYSGELTCRTLEEAVGWANTVSRPAISPLDHLSWRAIADRTVCAYELICNAGRCAAAKPAPVEAPRP